MSTSLAQLRAEHAQAVLDFERANRAYFALSISDRGDEFFDHFPERFQDLLAEQAAGGSAFFVLLDDDGDVVGRVNLYHLEAGAADVGYRVAQHVAGRGVATAAVQELCTIAADTGLHTLTAVVAHGNVASQRVLIKAGFQPDGPADPGELGGKQGSRYRRHAIGTASGRVRS